MRGSSFQGRRALRLVCAMFGSMLLLLLPGFARAGCSFQSQTTRSNVDFASVLPDQIVVPNNAQVGTVLYTSSMVSPDGTTTVRCDQNADGGIYNNAGNAPAGTTLFATSVTGVSYRLARTNAGSYLAAAPDPAQRLDRNTSVTFSNTTSIELVVTGNISNGATLSGALATWRYPDVGTVQTFRISKVVKFVRPACTVLVDPTVVTMAAITTADLPRLGATAGETPFALQLNCSSNTKLSITLDANDRFPLADGVINGASQTGDANNVGIQVLRPNGSPVVFGTAISLGTTSGGNLEVPFLARYYRTIQLFNWGVGPGTVFATATYTLTYQ